MISEYANRLADNMILSDQSEIAAYIRRLMDQGASAEQAQKPVLPNPPAQVTMEQNELEAARRRFLRKEAVDGGQQGQENGASGIGRTGRVGFEPLGTFQAILSEFEKYDAERDKRIYRATLGTFLQQASESGREVGEGGGSIYTFKIGETTKATQEAQLAEQLLNQMGKRVVLMDGPLEEYRDGEVTVHDADGMTGLDGMIYVRTDTKENPYRIEKVNEGTSPAF